MIRTGWTAKVMAKSPCLKMKRFLKMMMMMTSDLVCFRLAWRQAYPPVPVLRSCCRSSATDPRRSSKRDHLKKVHAQFPKGWRGLLSQLQASAPPQRGAGRRATEPVSVKRHKWNCEDHLEESKQRRELLPQ